MAIKQGFIRKLALAASVLSIVASVPAPAFAEGGHGGGHGGYYRPYHHNSGYYPYYGNYNNRYYYNRRHHRGGISGGEAALIAAGVLGGMILIDRALDNNDRRYDDRRYNDRYDDRYDSRRRTGAFDDDYYYQRDNRAYDDDRYADRGYDDRGYDDRSYDNRAIDDGARSAVERDDLDDLLLGEDSGAERGAAARAVPVNAAFRECVAETRGAAGAGGLTVAMPGAPTDIRENADGSVRMTAQFRASNARGESWTRSFVCEADEQGVRFLQVD